MTAQTNRSGQDYISAKSGLGSWLVTFDHKRIGVLYLVATLAMLLVGGAFGGLLRLELLRPGHTIMGPGAFSTLATLHGTIILFLFLVPSVAALGNFLLPLMIGARDVAYPKLNLVSFYVYVAGALFALVAIMAGSVDGGWTFQTPYDTTSGTWPIVMTAAVFVIALSSLLTGLNFIVTVRKLRAPGVTWRRLPLFVWGIYAAGVTQVLAAPLLAVTLVLLIVEKTSGGAFFDAATDGDPVLYQHFFWAYLHPAIYVALLPAMAVVSEVVSTFSRRRIFGYTFLAMSTVALAVLGFVGYGQHMFVSGMSDYSVVVFSGLSFLVAIPAGLKIVNWIATLYDGSVSFESPMLYAFGFIVLFTIGGLSGLFMSTASVGAYLHNTYFAAAHFGYAVVGVTAIGFLGGLHYWWPKMTGRMYLESIAKVAFALIFIGFNMSFLSQFLLGSAGAPDRSYDYVDSFQALQGLSSVGSFVLGIGFLVMIGMFVHSLLMGAKAPPNPWGSAGFEWATASPPLASNFHEIPTVTRGPYDYHLATEDELFAGFPSGEASRPAPKAAPKPVAVPEEE